MKAGLGRTGGAKTRESGNLPSNNDTEPSGVSRVSLLYASDTCAEYSDSYYLVLPRNEVALNHTLRFFVVELYVSDTYHQASISVS